MPRTGPKNRDASGWAGPDRRHCDSGVMGSLPTSHSFSTRPLPPDPTGGQPTPHPRGEDFLLQRQTRPYTRKYQPASSFSHDGAPPLPGGNLCQGPVASAQCTMISA